MSAWSCLWKGERTREKNQWRKGEDGAERETTFAPTQVRGSTDRGRDEVSFRSRRVAGTSAPRGKGGGGDAWTGEGVFECSALETMYRVTHCSYSHRRSSVISRRVPRPRPSPCFYIFSPLPPSRFMRPAFFSPPASWLAGFVSCPVNEKM